MSYIEKQLVHNFGASHDESGSLAFTAISAADNGALMSFARVPAPQFPSLSEVVFRTALPLSTEEFFAAALRIMSSRLQASAAGLSGIVQAGAHLVRCLCADRHLLLRRICVRRAMNIETAEAFGGFLAALAVLHAGNGAGGAAALAEAASRLPDAVRRQVNEFWQAVNVLYR